MARYLTRDVKAILEPRQLGPCGRGEDRGLTILTVIAVDGYGCFASESETSLSVVWNVEVEFASVPP